MKDESPPILTKERNLLVFFEDVKPNGAHAGQFNKLLMVRVSVPGDPSNVEYWVEEEYPEAFPHPQFGALRKNEQIFSRFGEYIAAYKANNAAVIQAGTPLEAWPAVTRTQIAMLRFHGVHTVEALSGLHDEQIGRIGPGGRELVNKAVAYLKSARDSESTMKAEAEKAALQSRLDALELKYTEIMEAVSELPDEARAQIKTHIKKNHESAGKSRRAA